MDFFVIIVYICIYQTIKLMERVNKYLLNLFVVLLLIGCSSENKAHKELKQIADILNGSTPIEMDEHTLFLKASVTNENVFQYWYQVINTDSPEKMIEDVDHQIRSQIKEAFALDKRLRVFKKHNTDIQYIYLDEEGNTLTVIEIKPEDYK